MISSHLRSAVRVALPSLLVTSMLVACGGDDDDTTGSAAAGASGTTGTAGKSGAAGAGGSAKGGAAGSTTGGNAGKSGAAQGGNAGTTQGGSAGATQAGAAGTAGSSGGAGKSGAAGSSGATGGNGGAGAAGKAGSGGTSSGGTSGSAGASSGGAAGTGTSGAAGAAGGTTAGSGGSAGAGGNAGAGGDAGAAGAGGDAGAAGAGGDAGAGGAGAAGAGGDAGAAGAATGGAGGAAGSGGAAGAGGLAIEFDDASDLGRLTDLYPALHSSVAVAGGRLQLAAVPVNQGGWYTDNVAPLLYVSVTGDFVAETDLIVGRRNDVSMPPIGQFNQAGFVVRDPATVLPGGARWIMYNMGYQQSSFAREAKTSRPGAPESLSTLFLTDAPSGVHAGRLRVCRVGSVIHMFHRHPNESAFVEEAYDASTAVYGNGAGQATPGVTPGGTIQFDRTDLGPTLQVGLMVGNWASPYDVSASFDYLRVAPVSSFADCLQTL